MSKNFKSQDGMSYFSNNLVLLSTFNSYKNVCLYFDLSYSQENTMLKENETKKNEQI